MLLLPSAQRICSFVCLRGSITDGPNSISGIPGFTSCRRDLRVDGRELSVSNRPEATGAVFFLLMPGDLVGPSIVEKLFLGLIDRS